MKQSKKKLNLDSRDIKLRHFATLMQKPVDYAALMKDLIGYNNSWLHKKLFVKKFKQVFTACEEVMQSDLQKLGADNTIIRYPKNIDSITFRQMIELQQWMSRGDLPTYELIKNVVAVACYSVNSTNEYDSDSKSFDTFKQRIDNQPALDMIGLFNHLTQQLVDSQALWKQRFDSVEIDDPDYIQAGGQRMAQFNMINTIRGLCKDFNCTYNEAWLLPYAVTQTRAYADASAAYTQFNMQKLKEKKMEAERQRKGGA